MGQIVPATVEAYLAGLNCLSDEVLKKIAADGEAEDLPLVDSEVGALLQVLTLGAGARRVLEIGTAIGYSGIWIARALPSEGALITLEIDGERAARAKANFARAGLSDRANVMIGDASVLLSKVRGPFDLIFQDGDKLQYGSMLERLIGLLRPQGLLVTDNVLWSGEVVPGFPVTTKRRSAAAAAITAYNLRLSTEPRLKTSWLPLRDGLALSVKV
jgi:predicted O-methyltransferase YrrM